MSGIGMLTLTGNTISMDVFGPVADNANGIGEMGYDAKEMERRPPGSRQARPPDPRGPRRGREHDESRDQGHRHRLGRHRGRLALLLSFIAVIAVGSEEKIRDDDRDVPRRGGAAHGRRPDGLHRLPDRRGRAVPLQLHADPRRRPRRLPTSSRSAASQFRDTEIWAGHQEARLRPRRRHLHRRPRRTSSSAPASSRSSRRSSSASSSGPTPSAASSPARSSSASSSPSSWRTRAAPGTTPRR